MRDLLFKDGTFRWNRLENLLRNARNSQDYNFNKVARQALDFLFSERGAFIRERLIDEIIQAIDIFGRRSWFNFTTAIREQVGLNGKVIPLDLQSDSDRGEHLRNIWQIIQDTPGFDPMSLLPLLGEMLTKRETQEMGHQILEGLVQKIAVRLIRNVFLEEDDNGSGNGAKPSEKQQLSLPSAD